MPLDLADLALPNGKPAPNLLKKHIQIERVPRIDVAYMVFNMDNPVIGGYTPAEGRAAPRHQSRLRHPGGTSAPT